ncbi:TPA: hypothetical protein HA278_02140 [Candidatus Woesearchaeota archaeon]|nr:hypothetical protein [Candidatus Woesearchaeota archaeon]
MSKMNFKTREVKRPQTPQEPPFVFKDDNGNDISVPMSEFRKLPQEQKEHLARLQMKGNVEENKKKGLHPAKPGFALTVVIQNCSPAELGKAAETHKSCPAKMKLHEDYMLQKNTYIARYFIVNGDEQKQIENYWLEKVPTAQFKMEPENGLTEVHRRSMIENRDGIKYQSERLDKMNTPGFSFNPDTDMHKLAKPCQGCGGNKGPQGSKIKRP